jgi:hypothetical protein
LRAGIEGQQLQGIPHERRGNYRGREPSLTNPFLAGAGNTVATGDRKSKPGIPIAHTTQFFEGAARVDGKAPGNAKPQLVSFLLWSLWSSALYLHLHSC